MEIPTQYQKSLYYAVLVLLVVMSLFFLTRAFSLGDKRGPFESNENVISFNGHGEVNAVPDIATINFTITKEAKTIKEAQAMVAEVEKKALDVVKNNNIEDKDVKTLNASFYPKYEYQYDVKSLMPCNEYGCPPRPGKNVIVGYEATESLMVKIRNTDSAGKVMEELGAVGVSDLNGPNFTIDKEDELKAEARRKAIEDAKAKAKILSKDLGVRLVKITNFSESGNYPMPYMYAKDALMGGVSAESASASLPKGENTITSDVVITYEIR